MKNTYLLFIVVVLLIVNFSYAQSKFYLCGNKKTYPYYNPELSNKKEFGEIKQYFISNFTSELFKNINNNTGIVIIQFHVNCEGNSGNFKSKTCNLNYKEAKINSKIIAQLKKLTTELNGWIPSKNENGEFVNSHKFYAFKIIKGVLIEILPK